MDRNPAAEISSVLAASTAISSSNGRFDKRTFWSALLGASLGFGIGLSCHTVWRILMDLYGRRSRSDRLANVCDELFILRRELSEVKDVLNNFKKANASKRLEELPPFFISDDEDEFFDLESEHSGANDFSAPGASNSQVYQSAMSRVSSSTRLGPPIPNEIVMEIDGIAHLAMGETSTIVQNYASGDDISLGMQAYAKCLEYRYKYKRTPEFLWRLARATYLASIEAPNEEQDPAALNDGDLSDIVSVSSRSYDPRSLNDRLYELKTRRQFIETGVSAARRALFFVQTPTYNVTEDPVKTAEVYKWLAILVGVAAEFTGIQQRIRYGYEFKELVDKAIQLHPSDELSYYLRGRWCYQVYNLSWIERQVASRLFSAPPTASLEEAEAALEKAESLRPNHYAAIKLYQAKCCICRSDYKGANGHLSVAKRLFDEHRSPPPHTDTTEVREEVDLLYNKYSGYV